MSGDYAYILVFMAAGLLMVAGALGGAMLCAPSKPDPKKNAPYECGEPPAGMPRGGYNFRYYIFCMFFVIFDVEAAFLFPWAAAYRSIWTESPGAAISGVLIFLVILAVPLAVAWRKGDLQWE